MTYSGYPFTTIIGPGGQKEMDYALVQNKLVHLWAMVGNTPMLELHYTFQGKRRKIYVKCEH